MYRVQFAIVDKSGKILVNGPKLSGNSSTYTIENISPDIMSMIDNKEVDLKPIALALKYGAVAPFLDQIESEFEYRLYANQGVFIVLEAFLEAMDNQTLDTPVPYFESVNLDVREKLEKIAREEKEKIWNQKIAVIENNNIQDYEKYYANYTWRSDYVPKVEKFTEEICNKIGIEFNSSVNSIKSEIFKVKKKSPAGEAKVKSGYHLTAINNISLDKCIEMYLEKNAKLSKLAQNIRSLISRYNSLLSKKYNEVEIDETINSIINEYDIFCTEYNSFEKDCLVMQDRRYDHVYIFNDLPSGTELIFTGSEADGFFSVKDKSVTVIVP